MNIHLQKIHVQIGSGSAKKSLFHIDDLKIKHGDKMLIQGASGIGKTTFLHMLAGLFVPDQGDITVGDTCLTGLNEDARAQFRRHHMGIVFQKLNLIDHLTALENIELSLRSPDDIKGAVEALDRVGLKGRDQDLTSLLSLGEQQRVAVARVLACDPKIVLADEPTSSLDGQNALEVIKLLMHACADKTLIVVSHDHRIASHFSTVIDFQELIQ